MPRLFSCRPLALAVALSTAFLGAVAINAGTATAAANPHALTSAQIQAYSAGPARAVIVELSNQHRDLASRANIHARSNAAAADQAGFMQELASLHATKVKSFSLINAFAATVPAAEAAHLATEAGVAAVVPDLQIKAAPLPDATERADTTKFKAAPGSLPDSPAALCPSNPKKPLLEPEALQLTNTAFNDPNTPQAQSIVDGSGVKVAFIADGVDPNNPDFIRANGEHVFVDYQDFSGDGLKAPTSGAEAFGDASAIAAQGRKSYDLSDFANPAHPIPAGCTIRVRGMAPGAQLVGLKAFGADSAPTSNILQAINYAIVNDNVDVINESFGGNPYPDNNTDPISLADEAAVAAGVVVVASTGDSGTTNTLGSPGTDPAVISAAATTQFRSYAQLTAYGFGLSKGTFASNNISSLSSGGVSQNARTPDVAAPGDLGWALCSPKPIYEGCASNAGTPSGIQDFGGTSQSSPLTAGEAALVIESYENTHAGAHPTPALVKQIITSTATDLGHPSYEQGAGLINSLAAVQAAASVGNPTKTGSTLLTSPSQISAIATPGAGATVYPVTVTNNGAQTQTLHASGRVQGPAVSDVTGQVTLDTTDPSTPFYVDQFGSQRFYVLQHFTTPAGVDRLDASIAAHQSIRMSPIRMILIDPLGTYQAYTIPQGNGNFGHVDVRSPVAGTWTAVIAAGGAGGFNGPVHFEFATSKYIGFGSVSPSSQTVAPGASATFNVSLDAPATPGDTSASLQITNDVGQVQSVPITVRGLISTSAAGGSFTGVFTGGNGRGFPGQNVTYMFDVPSGQHDFGINLHLTNKHQQVISFVISPEGQVVSSDSNVTIAPDGSQVFGNTMQMFLRDPAPGRWEVAFAVTNPIFGKNTSNTYSGSLKYNIVSVKATGLPTAPTKVSAKAPLTAKIKVTNTGTQTETFFADARTATAQATTVLPITPATGIALPIPPTAPTPRWIVPTETTSLSLLASATLPVQADLQYSGGEPEVIGPPGNSSTATASAGSLAPGLWVGFAGEVGPYSPSAPAGTVDFSMSATTLGFDSSVKTSTGDLWRQTVDAAAPGVKFLTLAPGQSGTIKVTITPGLSASTVVHGTIYVDTFNFFADQGDELVALPYSYTVG